MGYAANSTLRGLVNGISGNSANGKVSGGSTVGGIVGLLYKSTLTYSSTNSTNNVNYATVLRQTCMKQGVLWEQLQIQIFIPLLTKVM